MLFSLLKRKKKNLLHTIAFYNLENLFDDKEDAKTLDDDFTPNGFKKWSTKRYQGKLRKLATTIAKIGQTETNGAPVLIGVAEVENNKVLQDLIASGPLKDLGYDSIHYNSPDERGIDTGLIYLRGNFKVISSEPIALLINNPNGARDFTRDILYVHGLLNGEEIHVFVNHWPSRRDGAASTDYKRLRAAETLNEYIAELGKKYNSPNVIIMGDFNDGPHSSSIMRLMQSGNLYNPMEQLLTPSNGSANYKRSWMLFDQILISHTFLNYEKGTHSFADAHIFNKQFLKQQSGKYKGMPYRTYAGKKYIGGYSDHFPVYIQLKYNA